MRPAASYRDRAALRSLLWLGLQRFLPLFVAASAVSLVGCDVGIYAPANTKDGELVIVNRLTGSVEKFETPAPAVVNAPVRGSRQVQFDQTELGELPVQIFGSAKQVGDQVLIKISVGAGDALQDTDAAQAVWSQYMDRARPGAVLTISLVDADRYQRAVLRTPLAEFIRMTGKFGQTVALRQQYSVAIPGEGADDVVAWDVSWAGWPSYPKATAPVASR
jgi:hypothetical protein